MNKENERLLYKKIRSTINHELDNIITNTLLNTKEYREAKLILIYYPLPEEINTLPIIEHAFSSNKNVALPKCINNTIKFYYIESIKQVSKGLFNVMEPVSSNLVTDFKNSICIVPGLAFDIRFNRLGYGKGYYDRFLKDYTGINIGLCYNQLLVSKLVTYSHDIPVDMIITENKKINHF
jgi:5-formyltetrahydrofolate cyclo-ligase